MNDMVLFVYDFDGVMTDNTVLVDENGVESVRVHRADGLAVAYFKKSGIKQLILSTETNPVVQARASKLQIECIHGVGDKRDVLTEYLEHEGIDAANVLYIGNDINDLEVMKIVGKSVAPQDAHEQIKDIADIVTKAKGGYGVIRELMDMHIRSAG
jgi:YrbI family 3-deoxy-D-manno-octulosonate 8-phosphate phosphatase